MSTLPRVAPLTRERIAREFDDRGPEVCRTEIALDLEANNPEILDMATRCARDNATASLPSKNIVASMPQVIYDKTIMAGGSIF